MKIWTLTLLWLASVLASCAPAQSQTAQAPAPPATTTATAPMAFILPPEMLGVTWQWVSFTMPIEEMTAAAPERYTIEFQADGRVAIQADCNRGLASYVVKADRQISFGPIALTRMMCPPASQSDRYVRELGRVSSYFLRNGELFLELPVDSGTLRFRKQV